MFDRSTPLPPAAPAVGEEGGDSPPPRRNTSRAATTMNMARSAPTTHQPQMGLPAIPVEADAPMAAPHSVQNRPPGVVLAPQEGHAETPAGCPHPPQNLPRTSAPQREHFIVWIAPSAQIGRPVRRSDAHRPSAWRKPTRSGTSTTRLAAPCGCALRSAAHCLDFCQERPHCHPHRTVIAPSRLPLGITGRAVLLRSSLCHRAAAIVRQERYRHKYLKTLSHEPPLPAFFTWPFQSCFGGLLSSGRHGGGLAGNRALPPAQGAASQSKPPVLGMRVLPP